jgi:hypothetical protein
MQKNCKFKASLGYIVRPYLKHEQKAGCQWLMPIILGTWEAEIEKTVVQSQFRKIFVGSHLQNNQSKM